MNKTYSVGITGTGSYLPEKIVTNQDLEKIVETSHEWIVERTGIHARRLVDANTATSDLAYEAAIKAMDKAQVSAEDVDLIIVATVTPDMNFPSTACIVQEKIGARRAAAFDLEAACSGFLYGMVIASQFIQNGMYKTVLVIGAETLSKITDWSDRNTCVLFGDGAGAAVLQRVSDGKGIKGWTLGADGAGGGALTMPAGGSRMPSTADTVQNNLHYIQMDGSEVFKFASRIMSSSVLEVLEKVGMNLDDIDYLVPHQANVRIIDSAAKRLKLSKDKIYVNLDKYGNMSAASIPVALDEAIMKGNIKDGDNIVLVGFGGGLTWGCCLLTWGK
jgi:3-oxoacyl-[acyl-carrier-protein] synthase III